MEPPGERTIGSVGSRASSAGAYLFPDRCGGTDVVVDLECIRRGPDLRGRSPIRDDAVLTLLSIAGILHARRGMSNTSWTPRVCGSLHTPEDENGPRLDAAVDGG